MIAAYFAIVFGIGWAAGQVIGVIAGALCVAIMFFGPPLLVFALIYATVHKLKRPRPPTTVVLEEILKRKALPRKRTPPIP